MINLFKCRIFKYYLGMFKLFNIIGNRKKKKLLKKELIEYNLKRKKYLETLENYKRNPDENYLIQNRNVINMLEQEVETIERIITKKVVELDDCS